MSLHSPSVTYVSSGWHCGCACSWKCDLKNTDRDTALRVMDFHLRYAGCNVTALEFASKMGIASKRVPSIEVVSSRDVQRGEYIGRGSPGRAGSPLANPFKIGGDITRAQAVEEYAKHIDAEIRFGNAGILREIARLAEIAGQHKLVLRCWCFPEICHGDVIKKILMNAYAAKEAAA